jgi:acyl-CoA synthetase (NDP forming)
MKHALDPLLRPHSVAIVGASAREYSMGWWSVRNLERGGFKGDVYPVNPGYRELDGRTCYQRLSEIPGTPDLVIFAIGDHRLEQSLDEAIEKKIPAAVIMSSAYLDDDVEPVLKERVQKKVMDAGMLVCGANGMGFYNIRDNTWACGFDSRLHTAPGNASLISHSGSGMCGIIDCDERLRLNFAVSTGNELVVTMDQYLDFVLDLPETNVVGLFIETARNPAGFRAALEKARQKQIPVVALKVGRTRKSAQLAVSHSGAMAGDDSTYEALFDRYGVHRVADMDELATAMIMFAELNPIGPGGLVTLHDSGGERQLIVDLADDAGVPLTELCETTVVRLQEVLEPELPAVNPLDGWSRGGEAARQIMTDCLSIMMEDPGTAIAALVHDRAPGGGIYESYLDYMDAARKVSGKPVALVSSRQGTGADSRVVESTHRGVPVLDGVVPFLQAVRGLMQYRDFLARPPLDTVTVDTAMVDAWRAKLCDGIDLDEAASLQMLADFGINVSASIVIESAEALPGAVATVNFPVVLKTAMPGIKHKTEQGGVIPGIPDQETLVATYDRLSSRLGPRALVAEMVPEGVEMIIGARRDPQFGPVVLLGIGGVLAEVTKDVAFALPPFDAAHARRMVDTLTLRPLLDGVRGRPASAVDSFCEMAACFSAMVYALRDELQEVDVNPVIVTEDDCIAVDALVIGTNREHD